MFYTRCRVHRLYPCIVVVLNHIWSSQWLLRDMVVNRNVLIAFVVKRLLNEVLNNHSRRITHRLVLDLGYCFSDIGVTWPPGWYHIFRRLHHRLHLLKVLKLNELLILLCHLVEIQLIVRRRHHLSRLLFLLKYGGDLVSEVDPRVFEISRSFWLLQGLNLRLSPW